MRQTWAILLDAYRELNARKLFWVVVLLSLVVVAAFACVGLTPEGLKVLVWEFPFPGVNSTFMTPAAFYKYIFQLFGVGFWLTWISSILALIATCSMIPDFVSGGSIELTLSKPVGRLRMFLTKYAAGLLFTLLQVTVFSVAVLLLIGIRGKAWEPRVLLAIPIVVVFYSYLFSICALVGMVTRSAIFSLIATLLIWVLIFALNTVEPVFLAFRVESEMRLQDLDARIASAEGKGAERAESSGTGVSGALLGALRGSTTSASLDADRKLRDEQRAKLKNWTRAHRYAFAIKTVLPKTSETAQFLERMMMDPEEAARINELPEEIDREHDRARAERQRQRAAERASKVAEGGGNADTPKSPGSVAESGSSEEKVGEIPAPPGTVEVPVTVERQQPRRLDRRVDAELKRQINERSVWWVIGTSLAFEAVVLGIAGWIFCRRDF